jgi:hypothetical protein
MQTIVCKKQKNKAWSGFLSPTTFIITEYFFICGSNSQPKQRERTSFDSALFLRKKLPLPKKQGEKSIFRKITLQ